MAVKLYVGNLSYKSTEEELQRLFAQAGTVKSASIIKDRDTGRSKGFGFIEMETDSEAQAAINMFNGKQFQDRALTVNLARPREERGGGGGGSDRPPRSGGGGNRYDDRNRDRDRGSRY
jgi:RNA recognition motif-containing protein